MFKLKKKIKPMSTAGYKDRRCAAYTKEGKRCKKLALPGLAYCSTHIRQAQIAGPGPYEISPPVLEIGSLPRSSSSPSIPYLNNFELLVSSGGRNVAPGVWINLDKVYTVVGLLGSGSYGVVFVVMQGGVKYALKLEKDSTTEAQACREADMQKRVEAILPETPKIIKCDRFYDAADNLHVYTVMELMQGNCVQLIKTMQGEISRIYSRPTTREDGRYILSAAAVVVFVCRELARQVAILERRGIYHVDIKPQNMLYAWEKNSAGKDILRISLSDFGFACDTSEKYPCFSRSSLVPPEWVKNVVVDSRREMEMAQWYMVGKIIKLLLTGNVADLMGPGMDTSMFNLLLHYQQMQEIVILADDMSGRADSRKNKYWEIVKECDSLVQTLAILSPEAKVILDSMKPYVRRSS